MNIIRNFSNDIYTINFVILIFISRISSICFQDCKIKRMPPKFIELKPNRQLISSEFAGYKLSLDNIPILKETFQVPIQRVCHSPNNYSYLHAKLTGLHNHLIGEDIEESSIVYFINEAGTIQKIVVNCSDSKLEILNVFNIPKHRNKLPSDYNASFKFVSDSLAVLSDGMGKLYILQTNDRSLPGSNWKCLFGEHIADDGKCFIVQDARINQYNEKNQLYCLLYTIAKNQNDDHFVSVLYWVRLTEVENGMWKKTELKYIMSNSSNSEVAYAYLETSCEALYLISTGSFLFQQELHETKQFIEASKKRYSWSQTLENITCQLHLPENTNMDWVDVRTEQIKISVSINGKSILKGDLCQEIDDNLTNWSIKKDSLIITMSKQERTMWDNLIMNDDAGEYIIDEITEESQNKLSHLQDEKEFAAPLGTTFNSEQVEECDFEEDKYTNFERISCITHEVTHKININSHALVLTVKIDEDLVPALALRHDVDAIIWQPNMDCDGNFSFVHQATLNALGYVQASKTQRKFSVCAPDLSYCAICDTARHLFIYRQQQAVNSGELRNRNTGKRIQHTAQQQVVQLENDDEIFGIYAAPHKLFLLTSMHIYVLKL